MSDLAKDGGAKSRKMWFSGGAIGAIIACGFIFAPTVLTPVIDGIIAVTAIFVGGNTATKGLAAWASRGQATTTTTTTSAPAAPKLPLPKKLVDIQD